MSHQLVVAIHISFLLLWVGGTAALAAILRWHSAHAAQVGDSIIGFERGLYLLSVILGMHGTIVFGVIALVQSPALLEHGFMHIKLTAATVMLALSYLIGRSMKVARKAPNEYTAPKSLAIMHYAFMTLAVAAVFLIQLRVP